MAKRSEVVSQPEILSGIEAELATSREMSTEDLRVALGETLKLTAQHLIRLAAIVRTLEERGEDLAGLRIGLLPYLRQIAHGQVLPEIVIRYAESPMLVRAISQLPVPDQQRLSSGGGVALALRTADGKIDHRMIDPLFLRREQIYLIFARDRIRSIEEQAAVLEARPDVGRDHTVRSSAGARVRTDRRRGGIQIGRAFASVAEVAMALGELAGPDSDESDRSKTIPIALTEEEHKKLKIRSAEIDVPMNLLIRRALRASGLI